MDLGPDPILCGGFAGPGAEPAPRKEARTRPAGVVILIQALALALVMAWSCPSAGPRPVHGLVLVLVSVMGLVRFLVLFLVRVLVMGTAPRDREADTDRVTDRPMHT